MIAPHADGATLAVRARPGARRNAAVGEQAGALKLTVTAPPEDGRANAAFVDLLHDLLGVRRSQVELLTGATGRRKVFLVRGLTADELTARVRELLAAG